MPVLLSEKDVRAVLSMDDLIDAMATALVQFSTGKVQQPLRTVVAVTGTEPRSGKGGPAAPKPRSGEGGEPRSGGGGFYGVMPAFVPKPAALGTKLVTVYESNAARGLPTHLATIVLLDPDTGELLAILDGRYITEARTGAVSAVSAKHLARTDARVLAVVGSGVQARSHIEALIRVQRFEEIRVWGRDPGRVFSLVEEMLPRVGTRLVPVESVRDAVRDAGIVALVTAAREPVVERDWIAPGTHICAVGACRPDQREMDTTLVRDARVFVDSRIGALAEAGDLVIPMKEGAFGASHIVAELGEVLGGRVQGRRTTEEITIFKSLGMAVEDVAAARLAWERASERGLGRGFVL
jgi:ornithine cyclodeaminase